MKKDVTLYNVIFPFWMLLLIPQVWLIVLPGNFLIDSLVLIISMFALKMDNKKQFTWTVSLEKRISDFDRVKYLKEISNEENGIKQKSPFVMRGGLFFDMDKE